MSVNSGWDEVSVGNMVVYDTDSSAHSIWACRNLLSNVIPKGLILLRTFPYLEAGA